MFNYLIKTFFHANIVFLLFLISCTEVPPPVSECGCESQTISRIMNITGKLFYKKDSTGNDFNNGKYWIINTDENCINCVHHFIICNDNLLLNSITNIPNVENYSEIFGNEYQVERLLDIQFTGELKRICNPIFSPADYSYYNTYLTKITLK
ncbi:hypothetical protein EI427_25720 (plasmid) [Flammeovirga pectinis]|uniref:Uncharacterized protein n=1 Tax=Flammeovirga pectinis TaxID=2494373 RepID=A0A3S9PBN0_9BACT|nr:hypothetical protein [Flammeovirga pectinis]AZQ65636.1 hypothetical protein EI427_25720 [Flammeovirga pectinis]